MNQAVQLFGICVRLLDFLRLVAVWSNGKRRDGRGPRTSCCVRHGERNKANKKKRDKNRRVSGSTNAILAVLC